MYQKYSAMKSTLGVAVLMLALSVANSADEVAFSAGLSTPRSYSAGQTVVYDRVFINEGNGYNSQTGIFTSPKAGIYVFTFHGLTTLRSIFDVHLLHNGRSIAAAYGHTSVSYGSGGNTVILNLAVGDNVKIAIQQSSSLYGFSIYYPSPYNTFSGYRITATPW